jgi:hypothetical protein
MKLSTVVKLFAVRQWATAQVVPGLEAAKGRLPGLYIPTLSLDQPH